MTVTAEPKRAKTDANSMPTAPAPMTTSDRGICGICEDLVRRDDRLAVEGRPGRVRGREPVARRTFFVLIFVSPPSPLTMTLPGPSSRACPRNSVILFFLKR